MQTPRKGAQKIYNKKKNQTEKNEWNEKAQMSTRIVVEYQVTTDA